MWCSSTILDLTSEKAWSLGSLGAASSEVVVFEETQVFKRHNGLCAYLRQEYMFTPKM